ncbi:hypothetical protein BDB01DRAFT_780050 [Pilobolus umbonatus]|nr:hypothetical protein BDB01DRAFT_780050 [Pilobolus umbonatus]
MNTSTASKTKQTDTPDLSFLKDNPQMQNMLLLALLQSNNIQPSTSTEALKANSDRSSTRGGSVSSQEETETIEEVKKVGRRPVQSDDEPENPKSKRKAQNRAAQRAFRERKQNHVKELEDRVKELEQKNLEQNGSLLMENQYLKKKIEQLEEEKALLTSAFSFDIPLSASLTDERPQKIIRSSVPEVSEFNSYQSEHSFSSKNSESDTPEVLGDSSLAGDIKIADILNIDFNLFPSVDTTGYNTLLTKTPVVNDEINYTDQLNEILNEHRMSFVGDLPVPYPLDNTCLYDQHEQKEEQKADLLDIFTPSPFAEEAEMDTLCSLMKDKAQCRDRYIYTST